MRDVELEFRERIGGNPGLHQPPHVTFKAPFATEDLQKHRDYLDALALSTAPVEVEFNGISFFDGGVMFLDVAPNAALASLTRRSCQISARPRLHRRSKRPVQSTITALWRSWTRGG